MSRNSQKLHRARAVKNDEFYTRYEDVKKECDNYLSHFFNKIIYCNCDTVDSAFVKYFRELKAAGLVRDVWFSGGLGGDDFRGVASMKKLKEADIVITNPPFSLFRDFVDTLIKYNKQFLIIGNLNAISYKNICDLLKTGQIWTGVNPMGVMRFYTPNGTIADVPSGWLTNIKSPNKQIQPISLQCKYVGNEASYPKYDNVDAINVSRVSDIPYDYPGIMGVPISFINKYDPNQFILLGRERDFTPKQQRGLINGKCLYARLFICHKK